MGHAYKMLQLPRQAQKAYEKALSLNPKISDPYKALASLYQNEFLDIANAIFHHMKALEINPNDPATLHNLASALVMTGVLNKAISTYEAALKLLPDSVVTFMELLNLKVRTCNWKNRDEDLAKLNTIIKNELSSGTTTSLAPWYAVQYSLSPSLLLDIAKSHASTFLQWKQNLQNLGINFRIPKKLKSNERLRVGIVTADAGDTNVGRDITGWFKHHDPKTSPIEVYLYSTKVSDHSVWRKDIEKHAEHVVDLSYLTSIDMAKTINNDRIHILINLNGYTKFSKNEIFAMQPAPIQINFKGYPGTLGADYVQYIITDKYMSPIEDEKYYSEKFIWMPHQYQVSSYPDIWPQELLESERDSTLKKYGLPTNAFIFGDFNHLQKVTPEIFTVWMNILKSVPNSILWMLKLPAEAEENLKQEASKRGVDSERLYFTDLAPLKDHLGIKSLSDLFLDTTTFTGHGTDLDILWAGVPIITMPGDTFQSKAGADFAILLDCPEMVVSSLEEYEDRAVEWALDSINGGNKLKTLREKLKSKRLTSAVFDTKRWVKEWEVAMKMVWENYESGGKPKHIEVPKLPWEETIEDWAQTIKESEERFW